ncbi:eukaryotic integral membrane protein-domain-containing protein [Mycotypha africana]|uniref:eukaryotic integral membrane protein-domain-containing protein n=1 Tax=Mycotypha africana TaxID=64632 RepID=UPI0022FFDA28|nr:eukaryotic integral membrane protein-domain-containing protein [Mycotypha africana]KAI8970317.1 eukaryotic integral membrane protein-domain-containing protein [Mycotypha africana]
MAIKTIIANVPPLTKSLMTAVISFSLAAYIYVYRLRSEADIDTIPLNICPFIGLIPGFAFYAPWTLLTAFLYEDNLLSLLFSLVVILFCGKYLERVWGSKELLKFIVVVGLTTNVITWVAILLTYYLSANDAYLYQLQINGMAGVFSGFLVAFKHLIPEYRIAIMGGKISIRVKNLLGVATLVSILSLVLFKAMVFYNLVNLGWLVAWVYIRFFKYQDGLQGDRSEAFAIQTFFPEFLHPIVLLISNTVYGILVKFRLCRPGPRSYHDVELGNLLNPIPGSARAEAERRRALALKALDMRLSHKGSSNNASQAASSTATTTAAAATSHEAPSLARPETILFDAETGSISKSSPPSSPVMTPFNSVTIPTHKD